MSWGYQALTHTYGLRAYTLWADTLLVDFSGFLRTSINGRAEVEAHVFSLYRLIKPHIANVVTGFRLPKFYKKTMARQLKKLLMFVIIMASCSIGADARKRVKIVVTPSDAHIYVDGNYVGDGVVEHTLGKGDFIAIRIEKEGYMPLDNIKYFKSDKRDAISYSLRPDLFYESSVPSGLVNDFFSVRVSPKYYTTDGDGMINSEKAWKLIHQILLNYFDEFKTTDFSSGFIQTPWSYERFTDSKQLVRTRVTVKQSGISDNELVFQIKISSELAPLVYGIVENSFREEARILKKFEPLINEFQTRMSKN